jgi:hypothetical protein
VIYAQSYALYVFTKGTGWSSTSAQAFEIITSPSTTFFTSISSYFESNTYGFLIYNVGTSPDPTLQVYNTSGIVPPAPPICFKEGSLILCADDIYRPIEKLKKGDLIKTFGHGDVAVDMIGTSILPNRDDDKEMDQLYVLRKEDFGIIQDLYLTGSHSILVDRMSAHEIKETLRLGGAIYVTDDKLRLFTCIEEKSKRCVGDEYKNVSIYHICLEHPSPNLNYGIYANGLLVETCQKRCMEFSGMSIL